MDESWKLILKPEFTKPYFRQLTDFVREERKAHAVFPPVDQVFAAFAIPYEDVRVLILGQDPYHNAGQAHGLCFSVQQGVRPPPSLANIFQELEQDIPGFKKPSHGCLTSWTQQGVMLLNATLTVRAHEAGSHQGKGWEDFTDAVIRALNAKEKMVFILWGKYARAKKAMISDQHVIIESAHPSPMSAASGFFGSRPFSKTNRALEATGLRPVDWRL